MVDHFKLDIFIIWANVLCSLLVSNAKKINFDICKNKKFTSSNIKEKNTPQRLNQDHSEILRNWSLQYSTLPSLPVSYCFQHRHTTGLPCFSLFDMKTQVFAINMKYSASLVWFSILAACVYIYPLLVQNAERTSAFASTYSTLDTDNS